LFKSQLAKEMEQKCRDIEKKYHDNLKQVRESEAAWMEKYMDVVSKHGSSEEMRYKALTIFLINTCIHTHYT
jgi:hypothetical protein